MTKSFHTGLIVQGTGDWIGGMEYIRNLGLAILAASGGKVRVTIFTGCALSEEWEKAYRAIGDLVRLPLRRSLPERILGLGNRFFARELQRREIDFFYPLSYENRFNIGIAFPLGAAFAPHRWAGWIPDFQHKHLPAFFTEAELAARERGTVQLARLAETVVFSSETAADDFRRFWPEAKAQASVLRFATSPAADWFQGDPAAVQNRYHLPDRFFVVSNQFWQHKNHRTLFLALGLLAARGVRPQVVCTGSPADYRAADFYSSLLDLLRTGGCEAQVTLLGVIPRGDQIQLMRRSLAIVQPSLFEGWSTVVEDARLLGKRVLASDIAVHREQHPPGCRFFASESTESLADALGDWWATLAPGPDPAAEARASGDAGQAITAFGRQFLRIAGAPGFSETP